MSPVKMALASRAFVILAMVFWSLICKPYDSSAALDLHCHSESRDQKPEESHLSSSVLSASVVWDAVYYARIARCGYEYEQMHAFQPLLPLLMRFISNTVLRGFLPLLGYDQTLILSGYIINFVAFIFAAFYLYRLGLYVLEDKNMAYMATAFFCFNPASVFYSSIYTESLFACLTFAGMWHFVNGSKWKSSVLFGLSTIARSNGVLHAGFFIFQALHLCYRRRDIMFAGWLIIQTALHVACLLAPFICFQVYGYYQLCYDSSSPRPWCSSRIPYLYGFVQSHYWDVGFLSYFQVKQIPNFLSASPALLLASIAVVTFARNQPELFFTAGLRAGASHWRKTALLPNARSQSDRSSKDKMKPSSGFFSPANVSFVVELLVMVAVAFFVMHVQVSTRFLSSSPVIYWFAAHAQKKSREVSHAIWSVFFGYVLVGTLLFSNFYPFT